MQIVRPLYISMLFSFTLPIISSEYTAYLALYTQTPNSQKTCITYVGDYKLVACPPGTIFDQNCAIYERTFWYLRSIQENIRKGIIGNEVEDFSTINGVRFYKTKSTISFIEKITSKL